MTSRKLSPSSIQPNDAMLHLSTIDENVVSRRVECPEDNMVT